MNLQDGHARDLLIAGLVVGGILLGLYLYTGNWPPPVVVESNSMMHVDPDEYEENFGDTRAPGVPYGRIGTIDPGDLVLVKDVGGPEDVETLADDGDGHYGKPGEVVVYYRLGRTDSVPIIHRAMTYVERSEDPEGQTVYTVRWSPDWTPKGDCDLDQKGRGTCTFVDRGVTIEELDLRNRHFQWSGFITQGDNTVGNSAPDQVLGIMNEPVKMAWVEGVARGELPWFGLIKLVLTSPDAKNPEVADHPYYWSIGQMTAPQDLWIMLVVGLGVVGLAPVGIDYAVHRYRQRERDDEPHQGQPGSGLGLDRPDEPGPGPDPEPDDAGPGQDQSEEEDGPPRSGDRVDIDLE